MDWLKVIFYGGVISTIATVILAIMAVVQRKKEGPKVKWWIPLVVAIPAIVCIIIFGSLIPSS